MDSVMIIEPDKKTSKKLMEQINWKRMSCQAAGVEKTAAKGLEKIEKLQPDIIIAEIHLPDRSGLEMIEILDERGYEGEFIVMAQHGTFEEAKRAIQCGVSGFLIKPVDPGELELTIRRIRKRAKKRERKRQKGQLSFFTDIENAQEKYSPAVRRALNYIETHLYEELSLTVLCETVGLSPSYFSRLFKQETGEGFLSYVHKAKMEQARILLKDPRYKVYQAAEMLGYHNYPYFYQLYKKQFGFPPGERR